MEQPTKRTRPIMKRFFVDEAEERFIKRKMEEANIKNFSHFARQMVIEGKITQIDFPKLKQLRTEMNRIGVNINQIAKRVNENDEADNKDLAECLSLLLELKTITNKLIKEQVKGEL
ncbi:plasmid mobilization relaxosome protein MobC [Streptococcus suis]|uniref:plasmid mobilization protein n=1 Tax=Streptococcus suis TaxID=1307 RepID=UPI0038BC5AD7